MNQDHPFPRAAFLLLAGMFCVAEVASQDLSADDDSDKPKTIAELTENSDRLDGLFTLYRNRENGELHMAIEPGQIGQEYIYLAATEDGVVVASHFRGNYRDNRVVKVQRYFNRIELRSENASFYFDPESPLARAATANISPAVLAVANIVAEDDTTGTILIKADDFLLDESLHQVKPTPNPDRSPKDEFRLGELDTARTRIETARSYPINTEITVEYVYRSAAPVVQGGSDVTDSRYISIRLRHSFVAMPDDNYEPRVADFRLGHFSERVTDLTSTSVTPYRDLIRRWRLQKRDPEAAISEPINPIVWWIENTTPHEYRETIREAALRWNGAFEKIGFRDALVVRLQPDDAEWDSGDIRYNVLRWTASPNPPFSGYGPSFTNPRTGEIIGADVMLEHSSVGSRLRYQRIVDSLSGFNSTEDWLEPEYCSLGHELQLSLMLGRLAIDSLELNSEVEIQLVHDFLSMLTLHEIGHTLGFTHNFAASQMLSLDQVFDPAMVDSTALTGSVMDYTDIHVPLSGQERTNFFQTKPGPYDEWVTEYAYSPGSAGAADEFARLASIAARSTDPALAYGNDADDMRSPGKAVDPRINVYDMSSDAIGYAEARLELLSELLTSLVMKNTRPGESYQSLVNAYLVLLSNYNNQITTVTRYIGGVQINRSTAGQAGAAVPLVPVDDAEQVRAMTVLRERLFAPSAFTGSPELYSHLQRQRRLFDFGSSSEDPKIHQLFLAAQGRALDHLLHPSVLQRISDSRLYGNLYGLAELFGDLSAAVFDADIRGDVSTFRQSLQLEYVDRLTDIVDADGEQDYDYPSQSMALYQLRQIDDRLRRRRGGNLETRAHSENVLYRIEQALFTDAEG
jgi:hypothetical protein